MKIMRLSHKLINKQGAKQDVHCWNETALFFLIMSSFTRRVETCCSLLKIICYHFSYGTAKANYFKRDFYIDL